MQCEIDRDSGARFHWRLVGGDGTELAVAATTFGSAQDAPRAAADVRLNAGSANGAEELMKSGAIEPLDRSEGARPEAERQLAAAAERYREVFASMQEFGRPEAGQHVAVKAVGRAVHLVTFALTHAAESGVPLERLVELTGWEPRLVNEALAGPEPSLVARLAPAGLDPDAVAQAAASSEATGRLQALTQRILADIDDDAWSPAPADLADLRERLDQRMARLAPNARTTTAVNES